MPVVAVAAPCSGSSFTHLFDTKPLSTHEEHHAQTSVRQGARPVTINLHGSRTGLCEPWRAGQDSHLGPGIDVDVRGTVNENVDLGDWIRDRVPLQVRWEPVRLEGARLSATHWPAEHDLQGATSPDLGRDDTASGRVGFSSPLHWDRRGLPNGNRLEWYGDRRRWNVARFGGPDLDDDLGDVGANRDVDRRRLRSAIERPSAIIEDDLDGFGAGDDHDEPGQVGRRRARPERDLEQLHDRLVGARHRSDSPRGPRLFMQPHGLLAFRHINRGDAQVPWINATTSCGRWPFVTSRVDPGRHAPVPV